MTKGKTRRIEVMDTTLRDGEQAEGISMMPEEKRTIAQRLLETVKVDRIEVASARVSEGEHRAVKTIIDYADSKGWTDRIEILGFVDGNRSVDWAKVRGRARHQPPDEGLAASLPRAAEEDARAAPRRHSQDDRVRRKERHHVQRVSRGLVGRDDWLRRLRRRAHRGAQRDAREAHHAARHARVAVARAGPRVRRPHHRKVSESAFRFSRAQRLRSGHSQHARSGDGRRARRARHRERHGRARRQRHARRSRRGAARPRGYQDLGRRARAFGSQQARRGVLGAPCAAEQADRRRERVYANSRHSRRRRHEGQPVREPAHAGCDSASTARMRWAS